MNCQGGCVAVSGDKSDQQQDENDGQKYAFGQMSRNNLNWRRRRYILPECRHGLVTVLRFYGQRLQQCSFGLWRNVETKLAGRDEVVEIHPVRRFRRDPAGDTAIERGSSRRLVEDQILGNRIGEKVILYLSCGDHEINP